MSAAAELATKVSIPVPQDLVVAKGFGPMRPIEYAVDQVGDDEMILDIGPAAAAAYGQLIAQAGTAVLWNGPVGVFEFPAFSAGTEALARAIAASPAFSIAGGGDTLAAIDQYAIADQLGYISTGGGAFLEFVEGKTLPRLPPLAPARAHERVRGALSAAAPGAAAGGALHSALRSLYRRANPSRRHPHSRPLREPRAYGRPGNSRDKSMGLKSTR